jgi:hypothetical protein
MDGGKDICSVGRGHSPLFKDLGELQGNLALAAAAHAVEKEFAATICAAGARAEVWVESLQYRAPAFEESRGGRAMVDRGAIAVARRCAGGARVFGCSFTLAAG